MATDMTHWKILLYVVAAMAATAAASSIPQTTGDWIKFAALVIGAGANAAIAYFDKTAGREAERSDEITRVVMDAATKDAKP